LRSTARHSQSFTAYRDLYDFARRLETSPKIQDETLKNAAQGVMDAVKAAVLEEQHSPSYPGAHGLTIQLPGYFFSPSETYRATAFAQDTHWGSALERMGRYWFWPWPL